MIDDLQYKVQRNLKSPKKLTAF